MKPKPTFYYAIITSIKIWYRALTEYEIIRVYEGEDIKCDCSVFEENK